MNEQQDNVTALDTSKSSIRKKIENNLRTRQRDLMLTGKKRMHDEASFLAGASCALAAVFQNPDDNGNLTPMVPAYWIIAAMTGRSVLEEVKKD